MNKRVVLVPIGMPLIFFGSVWFLQGIDILPGSIMTGSWFWTFAGALVDIIGLALIMFGVKAAKSI